MTSILIGLNAVCCLRSTRQLSPLSNELMLEEGRLVPANPSNEDGLHYYNTSCNWFSSTRMDFDTAMDSCAKKAAYLTDILKRTC